MFIHNRPKTNLGLQLYHHPPFYLTSIESRANLLADGLFIKTLSLTLTTRNRRTIKQHTALQQNNDCLSVSFYYLKNIQHTPPPPYTGKLSNYVEMLAANGSIFTILAISFERYYAICKPLKAGYKCTRLRATIIICLIWFLASILTSPILFMAKSSQTVYIDGSLVYNCVLETDTYWPKMYVFGSMFAFFCLPLVLLILVYFLISRRLIRQNIAIMDAGRYDDFNRHGSNGQSGTGFERHKRKPSGGKRTNLRKSKSSKPFFSLLGHNNARLGRQDRIKSDKEILRDQRHSMAVDKINSVLISQLDVSKRTTTIAGQMLSINKTKSLDCQERKDMGGDIIAPIEEVDAISVSQSTWLHSNETNSDENNHLADIIVNETDSPKESSRSLNGFFSQLFSNSMFRFARGARKNSVEDPPSSADKMDNSRFIGICKPAVTMLTRGTESINCNGHSAKRPDTPRPTHSRLMNAASCPTATAAVNVMFMKDCRDSTGAQVASLSNGNGSIPSQYAIHCQDKCSQLVTRSMWSKRRMLESKKKQSHDTKGVQVQSKFKWIKNSSISSGTGSTYTNSTLLTSETSSKNESLRKYSRYNGGTPQSNEIHDDSSNSRTTPIKAYRKKSAHFNDCNAAIEPKLTQAYATLSTNSYSFSVSGDADNISENSSSPECLSTAPDDSKSSWLASVALHEHQSQHGASAQSNSESGCNVSGEMIKASKDNVNGENCALERDYANSRPASQNSSDGAQNDDCFNSIHSGDYTENCITEERLAGDNKFGCKIVNDKRGARQKIVRSLTDDRQPYGRTKLKTIQTGIRLPSEKSNCDLKISNSTVKHTGKKSLVTLAHNLSDNFNLRINKRRSGSQPLVTNQLSVNGTSEFFAVRDASKKQQMESRRQVVMMLAFVVACFFLLFFPYRVFTIWLILSTEDQVQSLGMETYYNLTYFSRILIYLHSAINPIAYNLISTKFRRAFMSILLCRGSAARRNFNYETYRNINVARSTRNKNKADSFTRPLKS